MKIGIKTFEYFPELRSFDKKIDFIEIMAIEDKDYSEFKTFNIPIVIHCQHQAWGVNLADKTKYLRNLKAINYAIKIADMLGAKKIIVHSGELINENCSVENSLKFLEKFNDSRILIENLPLQNPPISLCSSFENTQDYLKKSGKGFCFDINHAIIREIGNKEAYLRIIKKFITLNPQHFHFGGQDLNYKSHLNFKDSVLDIKKILSLLPNNAEITLETTIGLKDLKEDLAIIRGFIDRSIVGGMLG